MVRGVVHVNEHALTLRKKWVGVNDTTKRAKTKMEKNSIPENERKTGNAR